MHSERLLTPGEVIELTACRASTLSAWRNRLGFLPREGDGHSRFGFSDLVSVRLMVLLTARGIAAGEAVQIVTAISQAVDLDAHGYGAKIAIGRGPNGEFIIRPIQWGDSNAVFDLADDVVLVLSLGPIAWGLYLALRRLRGLPPSVNVTPSVAA
ncbi:MAG: hypothetical protein EWM45_06655 [Rhodopseudomonas palustris]|nr:MAG: hypothetical protein EWM45_06655 [Rhodopseudomonas palustris]